MSDNDLMFETLDIIATHSSRLDKLDKNIKELLNANKAIKDDIKELKAYLELKIEKASKEALKDVLDNIVITNNNSSDINVDTSIIAEEIAKLVNTKFNNSINIEPQSIKVDVDTKAIADKLDSTILVNGINKQIEENSKVQIPFPKIVFKLLRMLPLFSPRISPIMRKIVRLIVAPAVTRRTKAMGRSVKSPMLSRLREKR
jgi:hypothetical protein